MMDRDKLILIVNLCINGIAEEDKIKFIEESSERIGKFFDESVKCIFVPTTDETKPLMQPVTFFPYMSPDFVAAMEKALKENDEDALRDGIRSICIVAKEIQRNLGEEYDERV